MINSPPALVEMLDRNKKHAATYKAPPHLMDVAPKTRDSGNGVLILTCSDPRVNVFEIFGLDSVLRAAVIRNAGGRAADALRSVAVLQHIVRPGAIVVVHHTDCGGIHIEPSDIKKDLVELYPGDKTTIENAQFGKKMTSIEESVREDIALLKTSPLVDHSTQFVGLTYDTFTGLLSEVALE